MMAVIRSPYCTGAITPRGAVPHVVVPHAQRRAMTRCSVTLTRIGGRSNTCRCSTLTSGASARSAPHPPHGPVHAAVVAAWDARRGTRHRAVAAEGYPARDLADDLDLLDPHPDADTDERESITAARRRIVETARRAPKVFTRRLVKTVINLALCNLDRTACTVLRLLARSGVVEPGVAVDAAAKVLATVPLVEAGQTVAELAAEADLGLLKGALPNVISLAAEHDDFPGRRRTPEPVALLTISDLDLPAVTDAVVTQLDDNDETRRAEAADAAAVLLRVDSQRVVVLGRALVGVSASRIRVTRALLTPPLPRRRHSRKHGGVARRSPLRSWRPRHPR
jgi:hypothetical protein